MIIQTNVSALNLFNKMNTSSVKKEKSTEKLSTGYKINRAADNAAGLQISEKMRGQIRGLEQASHNSEDTASYMQVGEGALNEVDAVLQRMRELTIQALNDSYTNEDREAMAKEMDALQSELDSIFNYTEFNSQPVFEEHADTYYSIEGNVFFTSDQLHAITGANGNLDIDIDGTTYSIDVPEGIYSTQELMDEIDDVLRDKYPDLELYLTFTKDGYVNVNGENIKSIDKISGGLSYLIYGTKQQKSEGLLIGVSEFKAGSKLDIIAGSNDKLRFYLGNSETPIDVSLPAGAYTKEELIKLLNNQLGGTGVEAQSYGNNYISLFCPTSVITGLSGNMIKCDDITSVLYDISTYGETTNSSGKIISAVPMNDTVNGYRKAGVKITKGVNDILKFQLDGDKKKTYQINLLTGKVSTDNGATWKTYGAAAEKTLEADGSYQFKNLNEVVTRFNEIFDADDANKDGLSIGIKAGQEYIGDNLVSYWGNTRYDYRFTLESTKKGDGSRIDIVADDAVSKEAFRVLFTDIEYAANAKLVSGSNTFIQGAVAIGSGTPIEIDASTSELTIKQTKKGTPALSNEVKLKIPPGKYANLSQLVAEINKQIDAYNAGKAEGDKLKLKCQQRYDSGKRAYVLALAAESSEIAKIEFPNKSEQNYQKYWRGERTEDLYINKQGSGTEGIVDSYKPAQYTSELALPSVVEIDATNNTMYYSVNNKYDYYIEVPSGKYTRQQFADILNKEMMKNSQKMGVTLTKDNKLLFQTELKGKDAQIGYFEGALLKYIKGATPNADPSSSSGSANAIIGQKISKFPVKIDAASDTLTFEYGTPNPLNPSSPHIETYTVKVKQGTYSSLSDLVKATNDALKTAKDSSGAAVDLSKLPFSASASGGGVTIYGPTGTTGESSVPALNKPGGGFYDKILCQTVVDKIKDRYPGYPHGATPAAYSPWWSEGRYTANPAYIVGRKDIKGETVEIKKDVNDRLVLDFTMKENNTGNTGKNVNFTFKMTLAAGSYNNADLIKEIQEKLNQEMLDQGLIKSLPANQEDSLIKVGVDVVNSEGVSGQIGNGAIANDTQLYFYYNKDSSVAEKDKLLSGTYILDGVRGSAAYTLFYRTEGEPEPAYVLGAKDLSEGVKITAGENDVFEYTVDGHKYSVTIPEKEDYTAEELANVLGALVRGTSADDGTGPAPLEITIKDGVLKIEHQDLASQHTITDIGGSAKSTVFFSERGRDEELMLNFQVGANEEQSVQFKKSNLSTTLLGINSITVSKRKYAEKALVRLDKAIDKVSAERARFGVTYNRMEYVVSGNNNTSENLTASESRIRDTDMAKEMVLLSKENILSQIQESLMSQTGRMGEGILQLLK